MFEDLPPFATIALCVVPVAIIAAVVAPFSSKVDRSNDNLMTSIARLSGAALVFISAFTIATIWGQTNVYLNEASAEFKAEYSVVRIAEEVLPEADAQTINTAATAYGQAVLAYELGARVPIQGSQQAITALKDMRSTIDAVKPNATTPQGAQELSDAMKALGTAREARLDHSGQPGIPSAVQLAVMLLAWTTTAVLALYPGTQQGWVKAIQVTAMVTVVSLIQIPLMYLSSRASVLELVHAMLG